MVTNNGDGRSQAADVADQPAVMPAYLDTTGAARYLGVTEREVDEMRRQKKISFFKLGYRTIRFRVVNLDRDLERLRVHAVGE